LAEFEFDKYGRWVRKDYRPQSVGSFVSRHRVATRRSSNAWQRTNDFITNIGDWLDINQEALANNLSIGFYILAWVGLIIGVIVQFFNSGFWSALFTAIIGGIFVFYAAAIGMYILMFVLRAIFFITRYIFYNIYTLLLCIAIVGGYILFSNFSNNTPNTVERTVVSHNTLPPNNIAQEKPKNTSITKTDDQRIKITKLIFGSTTADGKIVDDFGSTLYTDIKYLAPKIYFQNLESEQKKIKLDVKIFNPDGTLKSGSTSPDGFVYSWDIQLSGNRNNEQVEHLLTWGNDNGTVYQKDGTYRFEIWCAGKKIYTTNFVINKKVTPARPTTTSPTTTNSTTSNSTTTSRTPAAPAIRLTASPTAARFPSTGGTKDINISTTGTSWDVASKPDWCTVNKTGSTLAISCTESTSSRSGYVKISSGNRVVNIRVSQEAPKASPPARNETRNNPQPTPTQTNQPTPTQTNQPFRTQTNQTSKQVTYLNTDTQNLNFPASGSTQTVSVFTDGSSYEIANLPAWCSVSNKTNASFQIVCPSNSGAARSGSFTVKSGNREARISVRQETAQRR